MTSIDRLRKELENWRFQHVKPNPAILVISENLMQQLKIEIVQKSGFGIGELHTFEGIVLKTPNQILFLE